MSEFESVSVPHSFSVLSIDLGGDVLPSFRSDGSGVERISSLSLNRTHFSEVPELFDSRDDPLDPSEGITWKYGVDRELVSFVTALPVVFSTDGNV